MADLSKGTTFVNGSSYGATDFNNLVDAATILPAFISGKSTVSPATGDYLVFHDVSGSVLAKNTIANILDLQLKDTAAGTASMRTLGTGATQAAQGSLVPYLASSNTFTGTLNKFKHLSGTAGASVAVDSGSGTGATASLNSAATDLMGEITLVPAGTPTGSSNQCTVTFAEAYLAAPNVVIIPSNGPTAVNQATANKTVSVSVTASTFTLVSGSSALTAGTTYKFKYIVHGG